MDFCRFTLFIYILFSLHLIGFSQNQLDNIEPINKLPFGYLTDKLITAHHYTQDGYSYLAYYEYHDRSCANYSGCYSYVLTKYDTLNNVIWSHDFYDLNAINRGTGFGSSFINGITTDEDGNIYIAGNYGCVDGCAFGDIFIDHNDQSGSTRSFFAKLDPNEGKYLWVLFGSNTFRSPSGGTDIIYKENKIYGSYYHEYPTTMELTNGTESIIFPTNGNIGIVELDLNGHVVNNYYGNGRGSFNFFSPNRATSIAHRMWVTNPKIEIIDEELYLHSNTLSNIKFDTLSLNCNNFACSYSAVLDLSSGEWAKLNMIYNSDKGFRFISSSTDTEEHLWVAISHEWDLCSFHCKPKPIDINLIDRKYTLEEKNALLFKFRKNSSVLLWVSEFSNNIQLKGITHIDEGSLIYGSFEDSLVYNNTLVKYAIGGRDPFIILVNQDGELIENWNFGSFGNDKVYNVLKITDNLKIIAHSGNILYNNNEQISTASDYMFTASLSPELITGQDEAQKTSLNVFVSGNSLYLLGGHDDGYLIGVDGIIVKKFNAGDSKIDISDVNPGIYLVKISTHESIYCTRIFKP